MGATPFSTGSASGRSTAKLRSRREEFSNSKSKVATATLVLKISTRQLQAMGIVMKKTLGTLVMAALLGMSQAGAADIVVGQVGPMTGLDSNQGRAYAVGMQLMFNHVNKQGGVNGHTFTLAHRDDGGRAENTVNATKLLLAEKKPLVLAGFFGNRNITDLVSSGVLEANSIAIVGYRTTDIRSETPLLYNVHASLLDEINKLAEHLGIIGINRIGFFYEDGPGAPLLLAAAQDAAARNRASIISRVAYGAATPKVGAAVDVFLASSPQAIIMVASGAVSAAFIERYRTSGGAAQLFVNSGADIEELSKRLGNEQMQSVAISQVVPNPYKIAGLLSKEFNDVVARTPKLEVPVSYTMMEGYIAAKVIVEAVRRQGKSPTRAGMVAALDGMSSYDLGGYLLGFKPGMRSGSKFVELSIITASGKIRQ